MILNICKNASCIDLVFDTYIEDSVKDTKRLRKLFSLAKYGRTHYYMLKWKHFENRSKKKNESSKNCYFDE